MNEQEIIEMLSQDISGIELPPISDRVLNAVREKKINREDHHTMRNMRKIPAAKIILIGMLALIVISAPIAAHIIRTPVISATSSEPVSVPSSEDPFSAESAESYANSLDLISRKLTHGAVMPTGRSDKELSSMLVTFTVSRRVYEDALYLYNFDREENLLEIFNKNRAENKSNDEGSASAKSAVENTAKELFSEYYPGCELKKCSSEKSGSDAGRIVMICFCDQNGKEKNLRVSFDRNGVFLNMYLVDIDSSEKNDVPETAQPEPEIGSAPESKNSGKRSSAVSTNNDSSDEVKTGSSSPAKTSSSENSKQSSEQSFVPIGEYLYGKKTASDTGKQSSEQSSFTIDDYLNSTKPPKGMSYDEFIRLKNARMAELKLQEREQRNAQEQKQTEQSRQYEPPKDRTDPDYIGMIFYEINYSTFNEYLHDRTVTDHYSKKAEYYIKDDKMYLDTKEVTDNSTKVGNVPIRRSLVELAGNKRNLAAFLRENGIYEDIFAITVMTHEKIPFTIRVQTQKNNKYFITVNEEPADAVSEEYVYRIYTMTEYAEKYAVKETNLNICGRYIENDTLEFYYITPRIPLVLVMEELGAEVNWRDNNIADVRIKGEDYVLDISSENVSLTKKDDPQSVNILISAPNDRDYTKILEHEVVLNKSRIECVLRLFGARMVVLIDMKRVDIGY